MKIRDSTIVSTRRSFLTSSVVVAATATLPRSLFAQHTASSALETKLTNDPRRPQFHLLPAKNWMNDPNGPIYFNGRYHMFFQYDPLAAVWGHMSWNHAVSEDMIHWTHLPLALQPTPGGPDAAGCFSGSAIPDGRRVYVVYTGVAEGSKDSATIRDGVHLLRESQCLAWSDDPQLLTWHKNPQPILPAPPPALRITGFRDPSAWKQDEWIYMTVGSGIEDVGGCVLLYRSKDLQTWEYLHKLTSGDWNGKKTANPCDDGEMWECPDFFAVGDPTDGGGHVLIYSTLGKVFWQSGRLDQISMQFHPLKSGELDLGAFYAPKTQLDAGGQRILWGWIQEHRSDAQMRDAGWSGMMSLPRVLTLDNDGTLRMRVLPQMSILRNRTIHGVRVANETRLVLPQATGEMLCSGTRGREFTLTMNDGATELLHVRYAPEKRAFIADGREITLQPDDAPTLHAFVDGSVVELILSERIGYTVRFYYTEAVAPDIVVHARGMGLTMSAWTIAPISNNRLSSPARI